MHLKKILAAVLVLLALAGCSDNSDLSGGRWYIDDRNNTVRTVATFDEKDRKLYVNYILIDEGRAKRTDVDGLKYVFDEYYYRDLGNTKSEDADDEKSFAVYYTKEDYEKKENEIVVYYHFEGENLVVNGNVCNALKGDLEKEMDKTIAENKAETDK